MIKFQTLPFSPGSHMQSSMLIFLDSVLAQVQVRHLGIIQQEETYQDSCFVNKTSVAQNALQYPVLE